MHNARTAFGVATLVVATGLCAGLAHADSSPSVSWPGVLKPTAPSSGTAVAPPADVPAPLPAAEAASSASSAPAPSAPAPSAPAMKEPAAAPAAPDTKEGAPMKSASPAGSAAMGSEMPKAAPKPVARKRTGDSKARIATDQASEALRKEQLDRLAAKQNGGGDAAAQGAASPAQAAASAPAPSAPTAISSDK